MASRPRHSSALELQGHWGDRGSPAGCRPRTRVAAVARAPNADPVAIHLREGNGLIRSNMVSIVQGMFVEDRKARYAGKAEAIAAYGRALEPKKLTLLRGGHFDAYVSDLEAAIRAHRGCVLQEA